jgi:SAM-dependent methyltransferase
MIGNPQEMRALTMDLTCSTWTLAAIGALFESGLVEHLREPRTADDLATRCPSLASTTIRCCLDVAAAAGVVTNDGGRYRLADGVMPLAQPPAIPSVRGDVRAHLMQALAFLDAAGAKEKTPPGWRHTDPAILQAQGDASAMFAPMFKMNLVGSMGDLAARLEAPGARFLDVGVGVASLAIAMCRSFPTLHVVGLDTADAPLALARDNIARSGLGDRIELREIAVGDLRDEASFDFAWLPSFFIPEAELATAVARVRAALRPGGWLIFPSGGYVGDESRRAIFALVSDLWGGPALTAAQSESLLKSAGFSTVRVLPGPPWALPTVIAQR